MSASTQGTSPRAVGRAVALGLAALAALGGCAQSRMYAPHELPAECAARHTDNVHTIDFSRLVDYSVSNELIDRGDVLDVTIETGYAGASDKVNAWPVRIADDGFATVPLVGRVQLAGLELNGAEQAIKTLAVQRGLYRDPTVTVVMKKQRVNKVTVLGAVSKPGSYELPRGNSNLLQAIVQAGGLAKDAGTEVEIRRPAMRGPGRPSDDQVADGNPHQLTGYSAAPATARPVSSMKINLVAAAREGHGSHYLDDGDVVMIEKRMVPPIHVLGLVHKPGQFELPPNQDLHVLDAIALAGGRSMQLADKVHLIRRVEGRPDPVVVEISMRQAKRNGNGNLLLAPGDVVSVEETPVTIAYDAVKGLFSFGFGTSLGAF